MGFNLWFWGRGPPRVIFGKHQDRMVVDEANDHLEDFLGYNMVLHY